MHSFSDPSLCTQDAAVTVPPSCNLISSLKGVLLGRSRVSYRHGGGEGRADGDHAVGQKGG